MCFYIILIFPRRLCMNLDLTVPVEMSKEELTILEKFTVTCNKCKSNKIEKEDSRGYSDESGEWGEIEFVCVECGNRESVNF